MDYEEEKRKQAVCTSDALQVGAVAGAKALVASGAAVAAAVRFWPGFARATRTSSRTALVITVPIFVFFLETELSMNACARRNHALEASLRKVTKQ